MKRALQYGSVAALVAAVGTAASGSVSPAFAEDTRPCYSGTPQVCFVQEVCTEKVVNYTFWPPSMTTTCLSKVVEYYYWTQTTSTSGGTSTTPKTTQPSSGS